MQNALTDWGLAAMQKAVFNCGAAAMQKAGFAAMQKAEPADGIGSPNSCS